MIVWQSVRWSHMSKQKKRQKTNVNLNSTYQLDFPISNASFTYMYIQHWKTKCCQLTYSWEASRVQIFVVLIFFLRFCKYTVQVLFEVEATGAVILLSCDTSGTSHKKQRLFPYLWLHMFFKVSFMCTCKSRTRILPPSSFSLQISFYHSEPLRTPTIRTCVKLRPSFGFKVENMRYPCYWPAFK